MAKSLHINYLFKTLIMDEKTLKQMREKPQKITNLTDRDFDFKWDGVDYTIKKWETQTHPFYLAETAALHMARYIATKKDINFNQNAGKLVDEIMGKEFIDYDKLTLEEAKELAKKRKISLEYDEGKKKNKSQIIQELKNTH